MKNKHPLMNAARSITPLTITLAKEHYNITCSMENPLFSFFHRCRLSVSACQLDFLTQNQCTHLWAIINPSFNHLPDHHKIVISFVWNVLVTNKTKHITFQMPFLVNQWLFLSSNTNKLAVFLKHPLPMRLFQMHNCSLKRVNYSSYQSSIMIL